MLWYHIISLFFFSIVKGFCCGYRHWVSIIREQRWCWFSWALVNHLYSVMTVCIIRETSHHHHHHAGPPPLSHRWRRSFYQTSKTGHGLWPQTLVQGFNSESFGLNHTAKVSSNIVWCWFNGCVVKKKIWYFWCLIIKATTLFFQWHYIANVWMKCV